MSTLVSYPEGTVLKLISDGSTVTVGASGKYNASKYEVVKMGTGSSTSSAPAYDPNTTDTSPSAIDKYVSGNSGSSTPDTSAYTSSGAVDLTEVRKILSTTGLSDDEKSAIEAVYSAVANGDQTNAKKLVANLQLAKAYADPMLAQQIALITDDLNRTVEGMDYDLEYQETSLQNTLNRLKEDTAFNKGNLGIELQQELKDLDTYFSNQLQETRDTMAARGMTSSSKRVKKEGLLNEQKGDMVESTNRKFGTAIRNLDVNEQRTEEDTAREADRLRELTAKGKLDLARSAESKLGSDRVSGMDALGGIAPLGDITGEVDLSYQDSLADFAF